MKNQRVRDPARLTGKHTAESRLADSASLNPAWIAFIRHCRDLEFGEISLLKIQDGVPVLAEESRRKIKFV